MQQISGSVDRRSGFDAPTSWGRPPTRWALLGLFAAVAAGCGEKDETQTLEPVQLGMTDQATAIYEQQDTQIFEVKLPVKLPIKAPSPADLDELAASPTPPYPRGLWLTNQDVKVQVTWTITNLDPTDHNVELLIDPWNEFGRYWPGMSVTDVQRQEQMPNLSGIDVLMHVNGTQSPGPSRKHGTLTFEDMNELAIDLGTVMNIIATLPPPDPTMEAADNPSVGLVNHVFNVQNRSFKDVLAKPYIPSVIPGLTGFDLGLRTYEPANVAIEIVTEIVDKGTGKVVLRGESDPILDEPTDFITISGGP
jgi:hypothetical protein